MASRWSGNLRAFDKNNVAHIVHAKGANYDHAAARMFAEQRKRGNYYTHAETLGGHRQFSPPKRRDEPINGNHTNGFKLEDCMSSLNGAHANEGTVKGFSGVRASRDKAAVGPEIDGETHRALHRETPRIAVKDMGTRRVTNFTRVLSIAPLLPDPFDVDAVISRLGLAGHDELAKNRQYVNTIITEAVNKKKIFLRTPTRGVFTVNRESEYFTTVAPAPAPAEARAVETPAVSVPAPQPSAPVDAAALTPVERAERLLAMAATAIMVSDSDRSIIERAMEASQKVQAAQKESDEANLALVDLLERMLGTTQLRSIFSTSMRVTSNERKA